MVVFILLLFLYLCTGNTVGLITTYLGTNIAHTNARLCNVNSFNILHIYYIITQKNDLIMKIATLHLS